MINKKNNVIYSADGLAKKIGKMGLSRKEAFQVKTAVNELQNVSVAELMENGKVQKVK